MRAKYQENTNPLPAAITALKADLGATLVAICLETDTTTLRRWEKGAEPPSTKKAGILALLEVTRQLRSFYDKKETQLWLVTWNDYLWGVPGRDLMRRPADVEAAALDVLASQRQVSFDSLGGESLGDLHGRSDDSERGT